MKATTETDEEMISSADLKRDLQALREDLRQIRLDVRGLASDAAAAGRGRAQEFCEGVDERVQAATAKGQEAVDDFRAQVWEHPMTTLVTAFGAGLLAGLLVRRR
ncbi:MAG TPA: hypothetical protein VGM03_13665 [Phycisphaerae bacterium]|jgi:ElaB/YqjD/DUF883 family membrane-anchored ribosome-binding protein